MKNKPSTHHTTKTSANMLHPKLKPLGDRVLLEELDEKDSHRKTEAGIIIPETVDSEKGSKKGRVVAVGEGRYEDGKIIPVKVAVGDKVLFQWGDKLKIAGTEYYIVRESEILAVIK